MLSFMYTFSFDTFCTKSCTCSCTCFITSVDTRRLPSSAPLP